MEQTMSLSQKEREEKYDELYEAATRIMEQVSACKYSSGKCGKYDDCCEDCEHFSSKGCTVAALSCKLWLCPPAKIQCPEQATELTALARVAKKLGFLGFRETKEEALARVARGERHPLEDDYWWNV